MKRTISLILASVMLLALVPSVTLAATPITAVSLMDVPTPAVGQPCSVSGVRITSSPLYTTVTPDENAADIFWYDETAGSAVTETDTFIDGHVYFISATVRPKEGFVFDFDESGNYTGSAAVNGKAAAEAYRLTSDGELVIKGASFRVRELIPITSVTVTGVQKPVARMNCSVDTVKIETVPADAFTVKELYWHDKSAEYTDYHTTPSDKFILQHYYCLQIELLPKDGYEFIKDESGCFAGEVTVNGDHAWVNPSADGVSISSEAVGVKTIAPDIPITSVTVTGVQTPVAGQSCSVAGITITSEPECDFIWDGDNSEIFWRDDAGGFMMHDDWTFEEERTYHLVVELVPPEGYVFDFDGAYTGSVTVNGRIPPRVEQLAKNERGLYIAGPQTVAEGDTLIKSVTVTGAQTPVIGQPCSVEDIEVVTYPENAYVTEGEKAPYIYWYDETDDKYTTPEDTFTEGHNYHISVELYPKEGYTFGSGYRGTATVNGKKADDAFIVYGFTDKLMVSGKWGLIPVDDHAVTSVTVTGVPTPAVGQPCFVGGISIVTDPADAIVTDGENAPYIYWWDETSGDYCGADDVFTEGHTYHIAAELAEKDGYSFCFDENGFFLGTVTFDGSASGMADKNPDGGRSLFIAGDFGIEPLSPAFIYGDVNADGNVNAKDASVLATKLAGWTVELDENAADVTCDGKVNGKDLSLMLKYFAGWDERLGA